MILRISRPIKCSNFVTLTGELGQNCCEDRVTFVKKLCMHGRDNVILERDESFTK